MPVCPKCGKSFSSEQALCYHLNKKYKCGTWKCGHCSNVFDTKFALKIHTMSCGDHYTSNNVPSYDILCKIYARSSSVFLEIDSKSVIHSASPSVTKQYGYEPTDLIGHSSEEFIEVIDGEIYRKTKTGDSIRIEQENIGDNIVIEHVLVL